VSLVNGLLTTYGILKEWVFKKSNFFENNQPGLGSDWQQIFFEILNPHLIIFIL